MRQYLILGMAFLLAAILLLPLLAKAETTISAIAVSNGAGYDAGIGVRAEHVQRWDWFGVQADGNFLVQKKSSADSGIKYGLGAQGRVYYRDWYAGGGLAWAGYESDFDSGAEWKKDAIWPVLQVGYDSARFDAWAAYYFRESDTPNETAAVKVGVSYVVWRALKVGVLLSNIHYTQLDERRQDWTSELSVGWQF